MDRSGGEANRVRLDRKLWGAPGAGTTLLEIGTVSVGVGREQGETVEGEEEEEHNGQRAPWVGTTGCGMHRGPEQKYKGSSAAGA